MVDEIDKALAKLTAKKRQVIKDILSRIMREETDGMDIKKLKGRTDIYRVRKGNMRILFQKSNEGIRVLAVEKRNDNTY
ncbi:MAG: Addiction module toxin, RelE/StbE family [Candidatus Magasanikbacteria bacterium GW2011_GWD2_43_18]|uniref:Addiction module toxin, RelE/StbE family n=1 Tax=Candidatus Magasanikbacteria bacterium GW2011_GWE2_42_7 TaxID=1619052 RepID=A0A0G1BE15_9BACT|nr:MAG: Addiction module toxin, RelE/StbE family [Candidatus Magasanikbacteria bacterium GW2011_GWC2_42_27]KKS71444.1 MAG: Addiction module toxin, RelE/StbE family [Candidatus Magasanikbacteria bacterium GW2011_GWE2_42_7]KKT04947.1 MAG: Addiction module toxin, RelE/StbE family [Candidatus Magasanikbacteria bacterium GW2011_GWD2_43_18]KKT24497.1 MAG: Addiction module toxin, RelE/StbE family [Candidatus Magasanikbacteria bacterium GW2011_GWA2_43_9]HBB38261.1 hypothetical protein [Candidatus Magas